MTRKASPFSLILGLALICSTPTLAQLTLESSTVDGGGGTSTGSSFEVSGTIGQFDAGTATGASFDLEGGFWTSQNPAVPVELMRFEISSSSSERSYQIAAAKRAQERLCRQEDKTATEASPRETAPAAAERDLAVGRR